MPAPRPTEAFTASPHSLKHRLGRLVWRVVQGTLFRWSPRPLFVWRVLLLRLFGADVTWKSRVYPRARIWAPWNLVMADLATLADDVDCYSVDRITIGEATTVSQYSYLCGATHDFEHPDNPLTPRPITIGDRCWIAADVFVGPGSAIADGVVVGARSSVFGDLPEWTICVGSPAKPVRERRMAGKPEDGE